MNTLKRIIHRAKSICFPVVALVTLGCGFSDTPKKLAATKGDYSCVKEYLTQTIKDTMKKYDIKGMSIALIDDQNIVWAEGFGYSDVENKIPATEDTVYRIGSISKLFTGIAVMQLYERDKIDIEKPLQTYIPEFSIKAHFDQSKYPPITPRNLLTHHSGLISDMKKGISSQLDQQPADISLLDYVTLLKDEYTSIPANVFGSYSDLGFSLLGALVEKVTEQNFSAYADKNIFQKLDMQKTSFGIPHVQSSTFAKGYAGNEEYKERYYYHGYPDGSVSSTVSDMAKFVKAIFADGGNILKPSTMRLMLSPHDKTPLDIGEDTTMGLAFKLNSLKPMVVCLHGGIFYPFNGLLVFLPEYKIGVVFLCNSLPPASKMSDLLQASGDIEGTIVKKALEIAFEVKTGNKVPPFCHKNKLSISPATILPKNELQKHVGFYSYGVDHNLAKITLPDENLRINIENENYHLIPHADGAFSLKECPDTFFSFKIISGYDIIIKNGETLWGVKRNLNPIPEAWKQRVGTYEMINATEADDKEQYSLLIENNILFLQGEHSKTFANPISDTLAIVPTGHVITLGGATLQAIDENGEQILLFLGQKLKRIKAL